MFQKNESLDISDTLIILLFSSKVFFFDDVAIFPTIRPDGISRQDLRERIVYNKMQ